MPTHIRPLIRTIRRIHARGVDGQSQGAERFARDGIVALVYDKRGVGKSGGEYEGNQSVSEKNISLLADDAVSALKRLSTHRSLDGVPVGFAGISQAGWIAPIAAQTSSDRVAETAFNSALSASRAGSSQCSAAGVF